MSGGGCEISVDLSGIEARLCGEAAARAQEAFARRVAFECRDYVPLDEGTLRDSEPLNSDYAEGDIVWSTPYAQRVHDLPSVRTVKNPRATPKWPEKAREDRLGAWRDFAARLLGGGA